MNRYRTTSFLLLAVALIANPAFAQEKAVPLLVRQPDGSLPSIPVRQSDVFLPPIPDSQAGGAEITQDFLESVHDNDAAMDVIVGQGRLLTLKNKLATEDQGGAVIAVGDPSVLDFEVIGLKRIRLIGLRIGTTDLSVITEDDTTYSVEVRVVADLRTLRAQLASLFPDSSVAVTQMSDHIVLEGQARSAGQVAQINETVEAWLISLQNAQASRVSGSQQIDDAGRGSAAAVPPNADAVTPLDPELQVSGTVTKGQIINLLTVPGSQQVMLKVQISELNRTGLRKLGASLLVSDGSSATGINATGRDPGIPFFGAANPASTIGGVIVDGGGSLSYVIDALRRNSVLKILAEPTLVSYSGHEATFLAGGEFPVPVSQGGNAATGGVTVEYKQFGVKLGFLPVIMDGDRIRLTVSPEVSSIDPSLGVTIFSGGLPIPGLSVRRSTTTMEMMPGQTLAMAGLLQVTLDNQTSRIPGLGDLPVLGPFFSNNSGQRTEKELIVMVTPYLVEPGDECETGALPGEEINEPNDLEFYLLGRIEGRTGQDFRSTTKWDDPMGLVRKMKLHNKYMCGPSGYSR